MNKSKVEELKFFSNALGKEMAMLVYLPKCYTNLTQLPVLYFFHGRSGNEQILLQLDINVIADKMIKDGKIKPMIIVSPKIENSRGLNSSLTYGEIVDTKGNNGTINLGMYEDYFIKEVVPLIDGNFNTIKNKNGRYIGGISAGGYVALHNAFRHQDMFSKVGGHMPALEITLTDEDKLYFTDMTIWEKYDPIHIVKNNNITFNIDVYLDAGDKDEGRFFEGCEILHNILKKQGINSQNHIFKGSHNAEYIKSNIEKYLKFYGA